MDTVWLFLKGLLILIQVILIFNVIIIVHELGHFLAARWRGLKVTKFQVWFGKPIWKKKFNGVEYGLGSIPAGGFVALPQMAPMDLIEGGNENAAEKLAPASPIDKIIVAIAGPIFSMLLAFVFGAIVWAIGYPKDVIKSTVIGHVVAGDPAEAAGLRPGDEIVAINGTEVKEFFGMIDSVKERIAMSIGDSIEITYRRPGVDEIQVADCGFNVDDGTLTKRPGLRMVGIAPEVPPIVQSVLEHSPAALAGLQEGDLLVSANGEKLFSHFSVAALTETGQPIKFEVERAGQLLPMTITPAQPIQPEEAPLALGIAWNTDGVYTHEIAKPTPLAQVLTGVKVIWRTLSAVASPKSDIGLKQLSGPVGISKAYYNFLSEPDGWRMVFWFSVILNVNLAILNMLPLPVLDGGHITLAITEMIRRRPVSGRVMEYLQAGCAILLISFMAYVTWFDGADTIRQIGGAVGDKPEPTKFAPPAE